jgi:hypothetical protein
MSSPASTGPWVIVPSIASPFDAFSTAPHAEHYWSRVEEQKCCISGNLLLPVDLIDVAKDQEDGIALVASCLTVYLIVSRFEFTVGASAAAH